jgi:hypothetical protein
MITASCAVPPEAEPGEAADIAVAGYSIAGAGCSNVGYWQALTPDELLGRVNANPGARSIKRRPPSGPSALSSHDQVKGTPA